MRGERAEWARMAYEKAWGGALVPCVWLAMVGAVGGGSAVGGSPVGGAVANMDGPIIFSCLDPAADDCDCRPPECEAPPQGFSVVNAQCRYSCHGVLAGLGLNGTALGYCLLPGDAWPERVSPDGSQRTLRLPLDRTSVIQGTRRTADAYSTHTGTSQLEARIDLHYAAL
jgi:hypothetical protein